jgi:hypothetical protein
MNTLHAIIAAHLVLHPMTPGRVLHALKNIRRDATPEETEALGPQLDTLTTLARSLARMELAWRASRKTGKGRPGLMELDATIDSILAAICELLQRLAKNLRPGPLRKAALELIKLHFPDGSAPVIRQPVDDELEAAEALLESLQDPAREDAVRDLGLNVWRDTLVDALPDYDLAIRQHRGQPLRHEDLRTARAELHGHMAALFVTVLARSVDQPKVYQRLARPIADQHEAVAAAYRNRVRPKEVDENTGAEIDTPLDEGVPEPAEA